MESDDFDRDERSAESPSNGRTTSAESPVPDVLACLLDDDRVAREPLRRLTALLEQLALSRERPARAPLRELERLNRELRPTERHRRREALLCRALHERGVEGPAEALACEHLRRCALADALDDLLRRQRAGDPGLWPETRATAERLAELLGDHVAFVEGVLVPLALRTLSAFPARPLG